MSKDISIYNPFINNIFSYDCTRCIIGGKCCRQPGSIGMDAENRDFLLEKYPYLRYFISSQENGKILYSRSRNGCWFLDKDGLCLIQKKHGEKNKPMMCRQDPLYPIFIDNKHIILYIDFRGCPNIKIANANKRGKDVQFQYDKIENLIREGLRKNYFKEAGTIKDEDRAWSEYIHLETFIRDQSQKYMDARNYFDFFAFQGACTETFKKFGSRSFKRHLSGSKLQKEKESLKELLKIWVEFLNLDELTTYEDRKINHLLVALTPYLRVAPYLQTDNFSFNYKLSVNSLPRRLLALYIYLLIYKNVHPVEIEVVTVVDLYLGFYSVHYFLSHFLDTPLLSKKVSKPLGEPLGYFVQKVSENRNNQASLFHIIKQLNLGTTEEKILFLKDLEDVREHICFLEDIKNVE